MLVTTFVHTLPASIVSKAVTRLAVASRITFLSSSGALKSSLHQLLHGFIPTKRNLTGNGNLKNLLKTVSVGDWQDG